MRARCRGWLLVVAGLLAACNGPPATGAIEPGPTVPDSAAGPRAAVKELPRKVFASGPETADPELAAFVEARLLELNRQVWDELHATAAERASARLVVLESLRRARSLDDREFSARVTNDEALQELIANEERELAQYVTMFGKERAEERARIFERLQHEQLERGLEPTP
jgi:hypothetical protein